MGFIDGRLDGAGQGSDRAGRDDDAGGARVRVAGKFFACGRQRLRLCGVTYGPFEPDGAGQTFSTPGRVADDFARMREAGVNALRTYHAPPAWLLHLADEHGLAVLAGLPWVDVPWRQHFAFLESGRVRSATRQFVRQAALLGRG